MTKSPDESNEHVHLHDQEHDHYYDDTFLHDNQKIFLQHYLRILKDFREGAINTSQMLSTDGFDVQILKDFLVASAAVQDASFLASNLLKKIDKNAFAAIQAYDQLALRFEWLEQQLDLKNFETIVKVFQQELLPEYLIWSKKVDNYLSKYINPVF